MTIDPEETGNTGFWKATGDKRCTQRTIGLYTVLSHPLPQQVRGVARQVLQSAAICKPKLASDWREDVYAVVALKVRLRATHLPLCVCVRSIFPLLPRSRAHFFCQKSFLKAGKLSLSAQAMEHARVNFIFTFFFRFWGVVNSKYLYCSAAAVPLLHRSDAAGNNCCNGDTSHLPPFRSR